MWYAPARTLLLLNGGSRIDGKLIRSGEPMPRLIRSFESTYWPSIRSKSSTLFARVAKLGKCFTTFGSGMLPHLHIHLPTSLGLFGPWKLNECQPDKLRDALELHVHGLRKFCVFNMARIEIHMDDQILVRIVSVTQIFSSKETCTWQRLGSFCTK
jgi:hypothetical protein